MDIIRPAFLRSPLASVHPRVFPELGCDRLSTRTGDGLPVNADSRLRYIP